MQVTLDTADVPSVVEEIMGAEPFLMVANGDENDDVADLKIRLIEMFCTEIDRFGRHSFWQFHTMLDVAKGFGWLDVAREFEKVLRDRGY